MNVTVVKVHERIEPIASALIYEGAQHASKGMPHR